MAGLFTDILYSDANLVSYYRLESNGNDEKGTNNLTVGGTVTHPAGKFGNGASATWNTTNYYRKDGVTAPGTNALTFWGWYKSTTKPPVNRGPLLGLVGINVGESASVGVSKNGYCNMLVYHAGGGADLYGSTDLTDGLWHFLAMTRSGTQHELYCDGVSIVSYTHGSTLNLSTETSMIIGNTKTDATDYLNTATVDDLAYFSRALTPTEISNFYRRVLASGSALMSFMV